ncbi:hypothetical protein [Pseudazoarcus pumilus]|uniref:Uncharacterized protein n=1 Tax=Pseudazoarcus pumilus TaxID=2067960 RepID=A0A2I6S845_9RHOO|nr:hypothetical protein [Pseudazoarcus pumilus]AUN95433.1 hypothetical protein C0099_11135 [Pseudazoarcus pumilus]
MTPVTVWLSPDLVQRLERIIDITCETHPHAEPQDITDLVMAAGIEAAECDAPRAPQRAASARSTAIAGPVADE